MTDQRRSEQDGGDGAWGAEAPDRAGPGPGAGMLPGALLVVGPEGSGLALAVLAAGTLGLDLPRDPLAGGTSDDGLAWVSGAVAEVVGGQGGDLSAALGPGFGAVACPVVRAPGIDAALPAWIDSLRRGGREPAAILVLGPPPVLPGSDGWAAWTAQLLRIERDTRGLRRAVLRPDALLRDWRGETGRVSRSLGFEWPARATAERAVDALVGSAPPRDAPAPAVEDGATGDAADLAAILDRWAEQGEDRADHAVLDRLAEGMLEDEAAVPAGSAARGSAAGGAMVAGLVKALGRSEQHTAAAEQARWQAEAEARRLGEAVRRLEAEIEALRTSRTEGAGVGQGASAHPAEGGGPDLRAELERAERDIAILRSEPMAAVRERLAALAPPGEGQGDAGSRTEVISGLLRRLREAEAEVLAVRGLAPLPVPEGAEGLTSDAAAASPDARKGKPPEAAERVSAAERDLRQAAAEARAAEARALERLADAERLSEERREAVRAAARARAKLQASLQGAAERVAAADRERDEARRAERAARARLAQVEGQLESLRTSTSWRLTSPLRWAVSRVRRG